MFSCKYAAVVYDTDDGFIEQYNIGNFRDPHRYLITGGRHAGEIEGVFAAQKMLSMIWDAQYRDHFFIVIPAMNPDGHIGALEWSARIQSHADRNKMRGYWRPNVNNINLNRDWKTDADGNLMPPQTAQSQIVRDLHAKYDFTAMLDFHSHMTTRYTSYICDNPASIRIAKKLNDINGCRWAEERGSSDKHLLGCPGDYYGRKLGLDFITIELGVIPAKAEKIAAHLENITAQQTKAFDWLFRNECGRD